MPKCLLSDCRFLSNAVSSTILGGLDDGAEVGAPPGPGAVIDNDGRVGVEWSVVCVELARLVRRTVVVRVTDR